MTQVQHLAAVDSIQEAESTARMPLEHPDLLLAMHAQACIVLACSTADDFLDWAKHGVQDAELAVEIAGGEKAE